MKTQTITNKLMTICALFITVLALFSTGNCSGGKKNLEVYSKKSYNYLLYLPAEYEKNLSGTWPLIIYLHDGSLRGDDLEKVKEAGLPRVIEKGKDFAFIIVSPQCPNMRSWAADDWFLPFLEELRSKYRIDLSRIYLTGVSFGGEGVWDLAIHLKKVTDTAAGYTGMKTGDSIIKASIITTNQTVDGADGTNTGT